MELDGTSPAELSNYRRNDLTNALSWAQKSVQSPDSNAASLATGHCILAMTLQRLGNVEAASSELAQARHFVESDLKPGIAGNTREGFWFDWAVVRRLLIEAAAKE
jgi:hypothetical protein